MEGSQMTFYNMKQIWSMVFVSTFIFSACVQGEQSGQQLEKVDWLAGPAGRIKSIMHLKVKEPKTESSTNLKLFSTLPTDLEAPNTIDSPPIAGFTPLITVAVTSTR